MTEQDRSIGIDNAIPPMVELVESAYTGFNSQTTFVGDYGKTEGYSAYQAASDILEDLKKNTQIDDITLALDLIRKTSIKPEEIDWGMLASNVPWEEFLRGVSWRILGEELLRMHPETREESYRRVDAVERIILFPQRSQR